MKVFDKSDNSPQIGAKNKTIKQELISGAFHAQYVHGEP